MPAARPARLLALALAWGLGGALGLVGSVGVARADCQLVGSTVTCSDDDTDGFDAGAANDLTVTVEGDPTPATVDDGVADANAITLNDRNLVTVETGASITADGAGSHGIEIGNDNDAANSGGVTNDGSITVTGDNAGGISGGNVNDVTNSGSINAGTPMTGTGAFGIGLGTGANVSNEVDGSVLVLGDDATGISVGADSTVTNEGTINAGSLIDGTGALGIEAGDDSVVRNEAGGFVTVFGEDATGIQIGSDTSPDTDPDLVNEGTITVNAGDLGATGVVAGNGNVIENRGAIGVSGDLDVNNTAPVIGMELGDGNVLTNESVITVIGNSDATASAPLIGVRVGAGNEITNSGRISVSGSDGQGIVVLGGGGATTITNELTGQILTDEDDGGVAILGSASVENVTNSGVIQGDIDLGLGNDTLTLFTGAITNGDLIGGDATDTDDALVLDGATFGGLDLSTVTGFESITIDAMTTDMDTMEDFFGTWTLSGSLPGGEALPNGLTLTNGRLRLAEGVTIESAAGFVQGAGTTLQILANPDAGTAGSLTVTGGGGIDLSAADDTLDFFQLAPIPTSTTITILEGASRSGVFETVPDDTPLLDFEVTYTPTTVELDITRFSYGSVAETSNQRETGQYLDRLLATGGNSEGVDSLLVALDFLTTPQLRTAYNGLHPEGYDAHTSQVAALGRAFAEAAVEPRLTCKPAFFGLDPGPLRDIPCGRTGFTAWLRLLFSEWDRDGDSDFFDSDGSRQAIAGGFDWRPDRRFTVTGYIGIGSMDFHVSDVGDGDIDSFEIGAAVHARLGAAHLKATLGYGRGDHEQDRTLQVGLISVATEGEFDSNRIHSLMEFGWLFEFGEFQIEPMARLDVTWVQEDEFGESDLGGIELEVDERENVLVGTQFGGRFRYRHYQSAYADDVIPYTQGTWTPEVSVSWRSLWVGADREIDARLGGANAAGGDFTVDSEDSEQGVDVGASLTFQPHGSGGSFSVGYDGFFGDMSTDHRFGAALEVYF